MRIFDVTFDAVFEQGVIVGVLSRGRRRLGFDNGFGIPIAEDFFERDGVGFRFRQLARPRDASLRLRARPAVVEFGIARRLFAFAPRPVVPPCGPHDFGHLGVKKNRAAVCAPGPAQIGYDVGILASDFAMREDKTERLVGGRRSGGDVTVTQTVNVAALEESRRRAEDEIHVARDVAVFKILAATIEQNRVLPAQKTAILETYAGAVYA